jgi:hypothetical protein
MMAATEQEDRLSELVKTVPPEKALALVRAVMDRVTTMFKDEVIPESVNLIRQELGKSDAVTRNVDEIARNTGDSREDVLLKALSLYEAAIDAKRKNQRLVVVGPDYHFIKEIVGFEQARCDAAQASAAP